MEKRIDRRQFLRTIPGIVAGLSISMPEKRIQAEEKKSRSLVIYHLTGGISPWESFTPFPDTANADYRGPSASIQTQMGVRIAEYFPRTAEVLHETSLIRSLHSESSDHFLSARNMLKPDGGSTFGVRHGEKLATGGFPYSILFMPSIYQPMDAFDFPQAFRFDWNEQEKRFPPPNLQPQNGLQERAALLKQLDTFTTDNPRIQAHQRSTELALSLLMGGGSLQKTFNIPEADLQRYGDSVVGRGAALTSRLATSGGGVTILYNEEGSGFDAHSNIHERMQSLCPQADKALAELIRDSRRLGFVLLCTSEFGRTKKINGSAGRDHDGVHFAIGAGGRFKRGEVYGSLDKYGEIRDGKVPNKDLMNTVLEACNVDIAPQLPRVREILQ